MVMTHRSTEEILRDYSSTLLSHGDFAAYFTPDVVAIMELPTPKRFEGRDAVRSWIEGAHALGNIRPISVIACGARAGTEWEFIRKDGVVVPYTVFYDVRDGLISELRLFFTAPIA